MARRSRRIRDQVKQDGPSAHGLRMIEFAVKRLVEEAPPHLMELLDPEAVLVPAPRSAPFPPKATNALWVPHRICSALVAVGRGACVEPLLERTIAVPKSAFAAQGRRPGFGDHLKSMIARKRLVAPHRMVVVDDVVTRGVTLLAGVTLLRRAHPDCDVRAFALIRTWSQGDIDSIVAPVTGVLRIDRRGTPRREP